MKELVIGADGFVGSHLMRLLPEASGTVWLPVGALHDARRNALVFDMTKAGPLPQCDIAYICAGANGFEACEGNRLSYRTNVDGTIATAKRLKAAGAFVVWISSCCVEWSDSAYARQKALTEIAFTLLDCGIVRAGRVTVSNVTDLCGTLIRVGRERTSGITIWNPQDK